MNIIDKLDTLQSTFTASEMKIYKLIRNNPDYVFRSTTLSGLAETCKTSQPTITRFMQKIGYSNFFDFRQDFFLLSKYNPTDREKLEITHLEAYTTLIQKLDTFLDEDTLKRVSDLLLSARNVYTIGYHKSSLSAQLMNFNLLKFAVTAINFNNDNGLELNSLADERDVAIVFSSTADTMKETMNTLKQRGSKIILITNNNKTYYKNLVDELIWLPSSKNQNLPFYLENQVLVMIVIDLISAYMARTAKFKR